MADLPSDPLEQVAPFTFSAVDYFGPFYIKEGRKEMKRYGLLFTCMALRGNSFFIDDRLILERVSSICLSKRSCSAAKVGPGQAALREMNQDKIRRELLKSSCDWFSWKMNAPHSSHMGGVWERQIRTVRSVLTGLLQNHASQLDDESLRTHDGSRSNS